MINVAALRAKRHETQRTGPDRSAPGYFRHPDPPELKRGGPGEAPLRRGNPMSSPEDVVAYAVQLGYRVAEDQMRKSGNAARRLRRASIASGSGDVGDVLAQGLRTYRRATEVLIEVAETLGSSSRIWSDLFATYKAKSRPSSKSVPAQDLNASLGKIADALAGKISGGIDQPAGDEKLDSTLERIAKQFGPALSTLTGSLNSAKSGEDEEQSLSSRTQVLVGCPLGFVASGSLMVRYTAAKELVCDGLLGKDGDGVPSVLKATLSLAQEQGGWRAKVRISEVSSDRETTYRGVVYADKQPVGFLEVTVAPEI